MSDAVVLGLFGLLGAAFAGAPALLNAVTSRRIALQAREHAAVAAFEATAAKTSAGAAAVTASDTARAVGVNNGKGTVIEMLESLHEFVAPVIESQYQLFDAVGQVGEKVDIVADRVTALEKK